MIITDPKIYQDSIQNLEKSSPLLRMWLKLAPFPFFGEIQAPTLTLKKRSFPLLQKDEKAEFKHLVQVLENPQIQTLILFGSAYGIYYKKIQPWLDHSSERQLLIFEDQIEQLQHLLATPEGLELTSKERVTLYYLNLPHFWEQNLNTIKAKLRSSFRILAIESYRKNRRSAFTLLKEKLHHICLDQNALLSEYLHTSPQFYENALVNSKFLARAKFLPSLFDQFKSIPAIICGAGPSMGKSAAALNKLQSKALIFAGGNALSVLSDASVEPHIAVGIDPHSSHEETFSKNLFFHLPLIYRSRVHHGVVKKAHGELLYTPQAVGYPYIRWLEEELGVHSPLIEEGMNVVNFSLMLALLLGCDPIILVGCDLAYQGKDAYDPSCQSNHPLPEKGALNPYDFSIHRGYYKKSNSNKKLYTLWKWVEEAKWISQLARKNPQRNWLNATTEGLKIPHLKALTIEEIEREYLHQEYDLFSLIHQSIQSASPLLHCEEKKALLFKKTLKSLIKCQKHLEKMVSAKDAPLFSDVFLEEEIAYQKMLSMISELYNESFIEPKDENKRKQKRAAFLLSLTESYQNVFRSFKDREYCE